MNILVLHNAYRQQGGEERVVEIEVEMLRRAGHRVHLEMVSNHELDHPLAALPAFLDAAASPRRAQWTRDLLRATGAEIVHVHNFFPLLTPSVHAAARAEGAAVVQTLHNVRLLCAASSFMRKGQACTRCPDSGRHWGIIHRCYRQSLPASLAVWRMQAQSERLMRNVHRFIALTAVSRGHFLRAGFPADRVVIKGNTVPRVPAAAAKRAGVLYAGRLTAEKGVADLVAAARALPDIPVTVVGTGPLAAGLREMVPANVTLLGHRPTSEVLALMQASALLVVPSNGAEGFPLVVAEALACGLPPLISDQAELVEILGTGWAEAVFPRGNVPALAERMRALLAAPTRLTQLSNLARARYETLCNPDMNLRALERIYAEARALARNEEV